MADELDRVGGNCSRKAVNDIGKGGYYSSGVRFSLVKLLCKMESD